MLTPTEQLIFDVLSAKVAPVPVMEFNNRKETKKEMEQRIYQNAIKHRALRAIKKNLRK